MLWRTNGVIEHSKNDAQSLRVFVVATQDTAEEICEEKTAVYLDLTLGLRDLDTGHRQHQEHQEELHSGHVELTVCGGVFHHMYMSVCSCKCFHVSVFM